MAAKPLSAAEKSALRKGLSVYYNEGDSRELRPIFDLFDRDRDGKITRAELSVVLRGVHAGITDSRVDEMMGAADSNRDGCIDVREFIAAMERTK